MCGRRGNQGENEEKEVLEGLFRVVRGDTQREKGEMTGLEGFFRRGEWDWAGLDGWLASAG